MIETVKVVGAGLAGSEAAYQLAQKGIKVQLYEMKSFKRHPAFKSSNFAELICSNSLRSAKLENAAGLLKAELTALNSLIMEAAYQTQVAAGDSLAVDREAFSSYITHKINSHPLIEVIPSEFTTIDPHAATIIASGPLTEGALARSIKDLLKEDYLYFYDAVSPIILKDSIDMTHAYYKSRYREGEGDYINCPLTKEEFFNFYHEVIKAECITPHETDQEIYFEGCMPFEVMAKRGYNTLLFGPMKPVGLADGVNKPYAVIQLRQDNALKSLYNIVGFQTHLKFKEQKRVLALVPALKNAEIVRYGVMHRNTYLNSPKVLDNHYALRQYPQIYFAGQISGVEGYIESTASGLYAALSLAQKLKGLKVYELGQNTLIGALAAYISDRNIAKLVPMNANFGILRSDFHGNKKNKRDYYVKMSLAEIQAFQDYLCQNF